VEKQYYVPSRRGYEKHIQSYLDYVKRLREQKEPDAPAEADGEDEGG
jgi:hypothetical protein